MTNAISQSLRDEREAREALDHVRADTLPEDTKYPDESKCEVSATCLDCPLAACKYDGTREDGGGNNWLRRTADRKRQQVIVADTKAGIARGGYKTDVYREVAAARGISYRSVLRILQQHRKGNLGDIKPPVIHIPNTAQRVFQPSTTMNVGFTK